MPVFPPSVGLGPVFFPSQGRLGHCPVHGLPPPVNPLEAVVFEQPLAPEFLKDAGFSPFLEAAVGRRALRQPQAIQRIPLHAGAEHHQNGLHTQPVRSASPVAAQWVRVLRYRQQGLHSRPQHVWQPPPIVSLHQAHASGLPMDALGGDSTHRRSISSAHDSDQPFESHGPKRDRLLALLGHFKSTRCRPRVG